MRFGGRPNSRRNTNRQATSPRASATRSRAMAIATVGASPSRSLATNYKNYGDLLGVDLVANPDLARFRLTPGVIKEDFYLPLLTNICFECYIRALGVLRKTLKHYLRNPRIKLLVKFRMGLTPRAIKSFLNKILREAFRDSGSHLECFETRCFRVFYLLEKIE